MTGKFYLWLLHLIETNDLIKFYKSKEWKRLRRRALQRDNFECQLCKKKGKFAKAKNVHHIEEVKDKPERALDETNLLSLCIKCHNQIHEKGFKTEKFWQPERW